MRKYVITGVLVTAVGGAACQPADDVQEPARSNAPAPPSGPVENVPIALDYTLVGMPLVGEPVAVNLEVSTPGSDQAVRLTYRSAEEGDMSFPETQAATTTLPPLTNGAARRHQFSLIPQREGRIYVVVSAELETERGATIKSLSVPVQVGRAEDAAAAADE